MKLFVNHLDKKTVESKISHLKNIDFSLFIDSTPEKQNDLSSINILVLQEPNEYFGLHDWAIQNKDLFNVILTWDDKILNNCDNALFLPFGHSWFKPDQYEITHNKIFQVSHLCGKLLKTYGQSLRHELLARKNEIKIPTKFFDVYGDRYNIEDARKGKEEVFGDSMFGVAIENTSHNGYFTEKILDCFLLKTIPIYWGCTSIDKFFNSEGIIKFGNIDEFIYIINNLDENYYNSRKDIIEENYQKALQYIDYEQNIINKITEIFKLNKLI
jgi:hypothetical protein